MSKFTLIFGCLMCASSGWRVQVPGNLHARARGNSPTPHMQAMSGSIDWLDEMVAAKKGQAAAPAGAPPAAAPATAGESDNFFDFLDGLSAAPASAPPTAGTAPAGTDVPELYVYDHCPFCVRVRLAFGILGAKHRLVFMENDDVELPTSLVGKKIAPIWKDTDGAMAESLDIIAKVDTEKKIAPKSDRTDLKAWQKSVQTLMRKICRPRYVKVPLPEFMKKAGRDAFVANHQMPPYEKKDWKGNPNFPIEQKYQIYEEAFAESATLIPELNSALLNLEPLIYSPEACTAGIGLSYDDIDLWARLRSLTVIKGVQLPPKVRAYLDHFEKIGDVPLYDVMAV
mmetsp:Transcript_43393/g.80825  ORF Transcript_43393/g.80825 Transcript_43393/m.80825 type:complete len:341 (+) Transcript_43393:84-1106(+)